MSQLSFIHSFPFSPTSDQLDALRMLHDYVHSQNPYHIFLLKGYAGTGKTSVLGYLTTYYKTVGNVVLLAPTGRAAKVLGEYCGQEAFTIHKKIYRLFENPSGERQFMLQKNTYKDTLFIIDECSMISTGAYASRDLLEDLLRFIFRGKNCRVVLAGDTAQLPPVENDFSPALDPEYLAYHFKFPIMQVELTQVVRQESASGILQNATRLREGLVNNDLRIQLTVDHPDVSAITGMELQERLEEMFSRFGEEQVLFITRSNKRANQFNQEIRNRLLFREEELSATDMVMAVKNNYHWLPKESDTGSFIANGESLEIKQIYGMEHQYGFHFANARVVLNAAKNVDIDVKIWMDALYSEGPAMGKTELDRLYHSVYHDYLGVKNEKPVKEMVKEDAYFNALQVKFSYAVTCHKSQGGQWEAVFIDHGFINEMQVDANFMRWMYTAITRARKQLFLVNFNEAFLS